MAQLEGGCVLPSIEVLEKIVQAVGARLIISFEITRDAASFIPPSLPHDLETDFPQDAEEVRLGI